MQHSLQNERTCTKFFFITLVMKIPRMLKIRIKIDLSIKWIHLHRLVYCSERE